MRLSRAPSCHLQGKKSIAVEVHFVVVRCRFSITYKWQSLRKLIFIFRVDEREKKIYHRVDTWLENNKQCRVHNIFKYELHVNRKDSMLKATAEAKNVSDFRLFFQAKFWFWRKKLKTRQRSHQTFFSLDWRRSEYQLRFRFSPFLTQLHKTNIWIVRDFLFIQRVSRYLDRNQLSLKCNLKSLISWTIIKMCCDIRNECLNIKWILFSIN